MGSDEDDWETADLSKPDGPLRGKRKPSSASDPKNLRPSAPTFLPRPGGTAVSPQPALWEPGAGAGMGDSSQPTRKAPGPVLLARPPRSTSGNGPSRQVEEEDDPWARSAPVVASNRQIWQAANTPQPYIPPVASPVGPLAPASGSLRILRRPSPSSAPASASGSSTPAGAPKAKTFEEREEEYKRARERIFAQDRAEEERAREKSAGGDNREKEKGGRTAGGGSGGGSGNGSQRGRERDKARQRVPTPPSPRDEIDEVIRAAEEMALSQDLPASASQPARDSASLSSRGRQRRGKTRQIPLEDDFETRSDMALRNAPLDAAAYGYSLAALPGAGHYAMAGGYGPSRSSSSGTSSPVNPMNGQGYPSGGLFDPFGASATAWDIDSGGPLRPAGDAGIVRQPRGPADGGGAGFAARNRSLN